MTSMLWRRLVLLFLSATLAACGRPAIEEGQVLARVNGDEISIHQFNFAMAQAPVRPQTSADQAELLDKLVDRQLAIQQALEKKLDRRPEVMMRLEEARRDILADAYAKDLSAADLGPTSDDVAKYFREYPALFSERKIYRLREISLTNEAPALPEVQQRLDKKQDLADVLAWLRQQPGAFTDQMVIRPAEQLPIEVAVRLNQVAPGEVIAFRLPRALVVYQIQSAEVVPLPWAAAAPVIKEHLKKQHDFDSLNKAMALLRAKAKIERKAGQS